jgi:hypothetical protein
MSNEATEWLENNCPYHPQTHLSYIPEHKGLVGLVCNICTYVSFDTDDGFACCQIWKHKDDVYE